MARTRASARAIFDEEIHAFDAREMADDFRVGPGNGGKFAGPVGEFVRPAEPGGVVGFPFGGHPEAVIEWSLCCDCGVVAFRRRVTWCVERFRWHEDSSYSPSQRLRMGWYASMRRSRRNGQLRRVSSLFAGSHSTTRISSLSLEASATIWPKGSATKELPQNSRPGSPFAGLPSIADAIDDRDVNAVGDGVSALNGAPGIELRRAEFRFFVRDASRCSWDRKSLARR